jgi:hypothetical protein
VNALKPFITSMDALLSDAAVPTLAVIGVWHAFLNQDDWIDSLTDRQFDWFMLFGSTLMEDVKS